MESYYSVTKDDIMRMHINSFLYINSNEIPNLDEKMFESVQKKWDDMDVTERKFFRHSNDVFRFCARLEKFLDSFDKEKFKLTTYKNVDAFSRVSRDGTITHRQTNFVQIEHVTFRNEQSGKLINYIETSGFDIEDEIVFK
jgi:hypothetical protein